MAQVLTDQDLQDRSSQGSGGIGQPQSQQGGGQGQGISTGAGPVQSSVGQPASAQGPGQTQAPTVQSYNPNQQKGSGYTNIQRIVQANQGNRLGQTIGGGIQQAGQQTQQQLQQAGQQFQQQSQANRFDTAQNQQLTQNVLQDPTQYAGQAGGQQFTQLMSGTYTGPQGLQNAQQLAGQAADVQQQAQATGSQAGQVGLLQRYVGNPQYQAGQQQLDALLLGQTGAPQLAEARRQALGLQAQTQGQITGAQQQAQELTSRAKEFGQNLQGQFTQGLQTQEQNLQQQAQQQQAARDALLSQVQGQFKSGNITADEAKQLGLDPSQYSKMYNIDPTQFLTTSNLKATEQNVASAQDYARMNALQQLAGQYTPADAQKVLQKFTGQQGQAGAFQADKPYTFDTAGYQKAYQGAKQDFDTRYNQAHQQLAQAEQINRMATGNLTSDEQQQAIDYAKQNPQVLAQMGIVAPTSDAEWAQRSFQPQQLGQILWSKMYAGQGGNAANVRQDWAAGNLQSAQQAYTKQIGDLYGQYGEQGFNIAPSGQS